MKGLRNLCINLLVIGSLLLPSNVAWAAEKELKAEDAKNGVVQVNTVFTDDADQKHIVYGGTGFLVGDAEDTEYVITCNHTVNPSDEMKLAAFEFYQIPVEEDTLSNTRYETEVVLEGDVVVSATIVNTSDELDLAVLQLSQPIYTRAPLTILTSKDYDTNSLPYSTTEKIFTMGYPDEIRFDSPVQYYSDSQVIMTAGSIVNLLSLNGVQVIESDTSVGPNNCGGPIVNEYGYVIGMNLLVKDGMYSCSLDSTKIAKVLDGLGVKYTKVNENPKTEEVKEPPTKVETKETVPLYLIIILSVGAVVIIALIITIIVLKVSSNRNRDVKSKKEIQQEESQAIEQFVNRPNLAMRQAQQKEVVGKSVDTNILSNDGAETSILGKSESFSGQINLGKLIRIKTNEKITMNKAYFSIGKDTLHVDYSIRDNGTISRQHAAIRKMGDGIYLEDCNSTNGTWVNNVRLNKGSRVKLSNGDMVKISNEEFKYEL